MVKDASAGAVNTTAAAASARADVEAQLRAMQPLCRGTAVKLVRRLGLPANIALGDLVQAGMVGAWQAIERFDGRGTLASFAAQRIRGAMLDYLRQDHPAGRGGPKLSFVSLDDEDSVMQMPAENDHARDLEARQLAESRLRALSPAKRRVVRDVLAGKGLKQIGDELGVSASRASQLVAEAVQTMNNSRPKTPDSFDPDAVPLIYDAMVPRVIQPRVNRYRRLMERMSPGVSVVLAQSAASSLVSEFKKAGLKFARRRLPDGTYLVTREPRPDQFE